MGWLEEVDLEGLREGHVARRAECSQVATRREGVRADEVRRLGQAAELFQHCLTHAEESRRLNVRALGTPQSSRSLRGGLEALELCSVAVRTFFRFIDDWVRAGMPESDTPHADRARTAWAELLADLAAVVRTFGALLRAETAGAATAEEAALADALDRLRLDRVRHAEVLLVDPREHPDLWEVDGALITLVDRMPAPAGTG